MNTCPSGICSTEWALRHWSALIVTLVSRVRASSATQVATQVRGSYVVNCDGVTQAGLFGSH
jgi:hypothetical protein